MKNLILGALVAFLAMTSGVTEVHAKESIPDQLEQCGAFKNTAPFCGESLEADTRQLSTMQMYAVPLTPQVSAEWAKLHREKRRGIGYVEVNEKGEKVKTGRPVIHLVSRAIAIPPSGDLNEILLFQTLLSPDMASVMVLLPAEGNFVGWNIYILSTEGKHALTMNGQLIKLGGRHRTDGNIQPDVARLPESRLPGTQLVQRGDGSSMIEALEATFVDHVIVNDRDGSTRVYSGLKGTFTPVSEDTMSVATAYTNCRTVGQRLVEKGNLRVDTGAIAAAGATGGLTMIPQVLTNLGAIFGSNCR